MPVHRVRFRRSFISVEDAHLDINATDAFEALGKAKVFEETGLLDGVQAYLEWREDGRKFDEIDRDIWVETPKHNAGLG